MNGSTITAIATPMGSGGIGIIRISGPDAAAIANKIFRRPEKHRKSDNNFGACPTHQLKNRQLHYGYIIDPKTERVIDEVLLVKMGAPNTYTAEDVVEIQAHSSPVALYQILQAVLGCGACLAEPGEFTKRAFLNGRIDLAQAEAVADIINAKSQLSLDIATHQLKGDLTRRIVDIKETIVQMITELEAGIAFSDELDEVVDIRRKEPFMEALKQIERKLTQAISSFDFGRIVKDGIRLSIVGRPNVGKSSLLNRLIRRERAIVTALPGTTRDLIEEYFTIRGVPIYIADTAGIHETENPVEVIGIEKARENLASADIVLFVQDATAPDHPDDKKIERILSGSRLLWVINKCDLIDDPVAPVSKGNRSTVPLKISALTGKGISELKDAIVEMAMGGCRIQPGKAMITNLRQRRYFEAALISVRKAVKGIEDQISEEFVCADLGDVVVSLGKILGETEAPDILDEIFSRFCIGK